MPKIRKAKRRIKFKVNVNRKRLKNKQKRQAKVRCELMQKNWDKNKSTQRNLEDMGLTYDPNKDIKRSKLKQQMMNDIQATTPWETVSVSSKKPNEPEKAFVSEEIQKEAKTPREKRFKLPKSQVEWLTQLLDKYGTNYRAMAGDKSNVYQKTWKQIRGLIKVFKKIPNQYSVYLEERGITEVKDNDNDDMTSDSDN